MCMRWCELDLCRFGLDLSSLKGERSIDRAVGIMRRCMNFGQMLSTVLEMLRFYLDKAEELSPEDFSAIVQALLEAEGWGAFLCTKEIYHALLRLTVRHLSPKCHLSACKLRAKDMILMEDVSLDDELTKTYRQIIENLGSFG